MKRVDCISTDRGLKFIAAGVAAAVILAGRIAMAEPLPMPGTVLSAAAMRAGIRRCYPMVNAISNATFADAQRADVVLDWNRSSPDSEPFFSLSGLNYGDTSALLSVTTAPVESGCAVLVERVSSAPMRCSQFARAELGGYRASQLVPAVTVYANPARPRETVTLLDAAASCVIMRRQVRLGTSESQ
ncbi:hypothetical protein [Burkholderia latens]|uniref:Uncharacterized protein n=1 Tax=Burkholderia latens TaxID=488446 RepID=A0A6H9TX22_9BURK|nr:hypothetical protein [Burkholderia latens]KAB0644810.1 hypothetical protein F7R21_00380 [Burkholderia latens]VWB17041.1 hypothetical protein BLA24064_00629 [Burkholderia latens]